MVFKVVIVILFAATVIQVSPKALTDNGRAWLTGFMTDKPEIDELPNTPALAADTNKHWLENFVKEHVILVPGKIVQAASPDQINHMVAEIAKRNMTMKPINEMTRTDFTEMQREIMELLNQTVHNEQPEE